MVFTFAWDLLRYICGSAPDPQNFVQAKLSCVSQIGWLADSGCSPCCYRAMPLLYYFKPVNGYLPDSTSSCSANIPPPAIRQVTPGCRGSWETRFQCEDTGSRIVRSTNRSTSSVTSVLRSVRLSALRLRNCHVGYLSLVACTWRSPPPLWCWNRTVAAIPFTQDISFSTFLSPRPAAGYTFVATIHI